MHSLSSLEFCNCVQQITEVLKAPPFPAVCVRLGHHPDLKLSHFFMPLYSDILQANFFDLKNSINCQSNADLETRRFWNQYFLSHITLWYIETYPRKFLNMGETTRNPQKTLFKFLAGVSTTIHRHHLQSFVMMKTTVYSDQQWIPWDIQKK
jgi:hypothetical protein